LNSFEEAAGSPKFPAETKKDCDDASAAEKSLDEETREQKKNKEKSDTSPLTN